MCHHVSSMERKQRTIDLVIFLLFSSFKIESHFVAEVGRTSPRVQAGLYLMEIILLQPLECLDDRHGPSLLALRISFPMRRSIHVG